MKINFYFLFYFLVILFFSPVTSLIANQDKFIESTELNNIRDKFKTVSAILQKVPEKSPRGQYGQTVREINSLLNQQKLSLDNLETIIKKMQEAKAKLLKEDQDMQIFIQVDPGIRTNVNLRYLIATFITDFIYDLKNLLSRFKERTKKVISEEDQQYLKNNFKPIFFMFYDLYKHLYYKYLGPLRILLQQKLDKEDLKLLSETLKWLNKHLNNEDQNQLITLEFGVNRLTNSLKVLRTQTLGNYINKIDNIIQKL